MGTKLDRGDGEHYPCPGLDEGGAYLVPLFRTFVLRDLRKIPGFQFFFAFRGIFSALPNYCWIIASEVSSYQVYNLMLGYCFE